MEMGSRISARNWQGLVSVQKSCKLLHKHWTVEQSMLFLKLVSLLAYYIFDRQLTWVTAWKPANSWSIHRREVQSWLKYFFTSDASALRAMSIATHVMLYWPDSGSTHHITMQLPHTPYSTVFALQWLISIKYLLNNPMHTLMTWTAVNLWKWPPQLVQQTADYLFNTQTMPEET